MAWHREFYASVPTEAVAFLGAVLAFVLVLVIFFLYLNKLFCFAGCGGFPCIDQLPKKKVSKASRLGAAYAYEDETSSSDSDDEVLKRFKSSMEASGMKRSGSRYSQKSSPPVVRRSSDTQSPVKSNTSIGKSSSMQGDSVKVTDETVRHSKGSLGSPAHPASRSSREASPQTPTPQDQRELLGSGSASSPPLSTSVTTESTQALEGPGQTYENQAYDGLSVSVSGSEPIADEHLFDVSDLQNDAPLISKCGSLEVTFSYNTRRNRMELTIHQAQEIPAKERGGANSTQVRMLLLPTKKQRHKTKVKQGDNPMFEETFVFNKVLPEEVSGMGIRFRLYGTERMRRERMIGESIIGFASLNLDTPSTHWVILEPRSNLSQGDSNMDVSSLSRSDSASSTQSLQHGGMPELLLGLTYNGTTGRLSVEVIKGSNFRNMAMNRAPDTYVKLTLMSPNGAEVAHSKTSVRRGQPNPLFKETFMFQVALFQLADVTLMVSVYNKKSMKKKEMIGWFSLGMNSSGEEEASHWTDMRESKGDNICRWHVLLES